MKLFSLSQTTRFGSHTVARVKAPNKATALRLFRDWYKSRGLPKIMPKGTYGLIIGPISLACFEEGGVHLHADILARTVTPFTPQAPHSRVHLGVVLDPQPVLPPQKTPARKVSSNARKLPKRKRRIRGSR